MLWCVILSFWILIKILILKDNMLVDKDQICYNMIKEYVFRIIRMHKIGSDDTFQHSGPYFLNLLDLRWEPDQETAENFFTGLRDRYSGTYQSFSETI